jgi:hypothetical protein
VSRLISPRKPEAPWVPDDLLTGGAAVEYRRHQPSDESHRTEKAWSADLEQKRSRRQRRSRALPSPFFGQHRLQLASRKHTAGRSQIAIVTT